MNNYRDYCLEPRALEVIVTTGIIGSTVAHVCISAKDYVKSDSDEYHNWVSEWKRVYNSLSETISNLKKEMRDKENSVIEDQQVYQIAVNNLRALANSMLNARQWARDYRRSNGR